MSEHLLKPRIYGKLPLQGDFIYQLPDSFTNIWDEWLKQGLTYSQDYFTKNWKAIFNKAPSWHFFLAPKKYGDSAWLGIMLPSHDKSGRCFPVVLAVELPLQATYEQFEDPMIRAWLNHLESMTRELIAENNAVSLEDFQKSLPTFKLTFKNITLDRDEITQGKQLKTVYCFAQSDENGENKDFYQHIESNYLKHNREIGFCLWASDTVPAGRLFSDGLPPAELFGAFLDKDYEGWGWKNIFFDKEKTLRPLKRVQPLYKNLQDEQPLNWVSSALTNVGKRRTINEDDYLVKDNIGLWAVADGMGGYDSGDFASQAVIAALSKIKKPYKMSEFVDSVEKTILTTNDKLLQHFSDLDSRGGCTVVCLLTFAYHCVVIWAGDSRLYRYRNNQLKMLTRDHSEAEEAVERGEMTAEEAEHHPSGNTITRAVGIESRLYLDMDIFSIQSGDILLLCSDGLYKEMIDSEIEQQISVHLSDIDTATLTLMSICLERKGRDNITLILVKIA